MGLSVHMNFSVVTQNPLVTGILKFAKLKANIKEELRLGKDVAVHYSASFGASRQGGKAGQ